MAALWPVNSKKGEPLPKCFGWRGFLQNGGGREMGAMTYGKLVNGRLVPAPNPLPVRNGEVRDPSGDLYAAVGYKLVVETPAPDTAADPSALTPHWEEWDGQIVRVWL